ncbi:unnamed protein product [Rhizopus microsporus]
MGLGKTLQTLTLILRQQPRLNVHAPTLIVIPSIAVGEQWADEINQKQSLEVFLILFIKMTIATCSISLCFEW